MKPLPFLIAVLACAACANFPELEGEEPTNVKKARYPKLIALQQNLGPPVDPVSEAAEVEEELNARREVLENKADQLQNAEIN
ncbi:hypothetical protein [Ruegeria lacuscaerulensis]|uniref:hypothetical protein n=1 Tax=Ruegeria lacuscaerulensis TaxID=55218 RepID=UPI001481D156|nr:hypothetical protein [Ruegeria lacuscaerulensis]